MKIQAVLPILIRTLGPVLLRGGLGGSSGGSGGATTSTSTDDDDDDDFASEVAQNTGGRKVSVSLPMFEVGGDDEEEDDEDLGLPSSSSTTTTTSATTSLASSQSEVSSFGTSSIDNTAQRISLPTTLEDSLPKTGSETTDNENLI